MRASRLTSTICSPLQGSAAAVSSEPISILLARREVVPAAIRARDELRALVRLRDAPMVLTLRISHIGRCVRANLPVRWRQSRRTPTVASGGCGSHPKEYPNEYVETDVEIVSADVEIVSADVEIVSADVEIVSADVEIVSADVEVVRSSCAGQEEH